MLRRHLAGVLIAGLCLAVSGAVFAWTASSLALAGSTPATFFGPAAGQGMVITAVGLAVLLVAFARRRWRFAALALWFVVLAVSTHRVVDIGPDGVSDVWLGMPVMTDRHYAETDARPRRCSLAGLPALCLDRAGRKHQLLTIVPFTRFEDTSAGLRPVQ